MYTACFKRKEKKNDKIEGVSVMLLLAIVEYFIVL